MAESRAGHTAEMQAVRLAPVILAPRHLVCVLIEILPADPMVDAYSARRNRLKKLSA
jgi:hypothetical protein